MADHLETGRVGERLAEDYLADKGFRILARNYRFEHGEIDLICFLPANRYQDGGELIFVEVKTRRGTGFGNPEEAVDAKKQQQLIKTARIYLHESRMEGTPCRFDVVAIVLESKRDVAKEIRHLENAFWTF